MKLDKMAKLLKLKVGDIVRYKHCGLCVYFKIVEIKEENGNILVGGWGEPSPEMCDARNGIGQWRNINEVELV